MKNAVFAVVLLFAASGIVYAQEVDSTCLIRWEDSPDCPCYLDPSFVFFNNDSVRVDTCVGRGYLEEFAKNKFDVNFHYYIFPDSLAPIADSLSHNWKDLDPKYQYLKVALDSLEIHFGPFELQHIIVPTDTLRDTSKWWWTKRWNVNFQHYVNI